MKIRRYILAVGLLVAPLLFVARAPVLAADAAADSRTVTIGVPDMH